jgi:NDP-sugar pyrophosphorylase family protein
MNALIFAAGTGERLRPYTQKAAKPAIPFLNIPIIAYPLFYLEQAGLKNLVVNTHHLPATIEKAVKSILHPLNSVMFSHEPEILGSGGGLAQAMDLLADDEDVFVANGDAVALFPSPDVLKDLLDLHREESALASLLVCPFPPAQENFGGVYVNIKNQVTAFSKTPLNDPHSKPWHFTGFMVVNSRVWKGLAKKPSNLLYDVLLPKIKAGGRVMAFSQPKTFWFETGNVRDYLNATKSCLEILSEPSWAEQTLAHILERYSPGWRRGFSGAKGGDLGLIGPSNVQNIQVRGFGVVAPGAQVEKNVTLIRSVIGGSAVLTAGQTVTDQLIL